MGGMAIGPVFVLGVAGVTSALSTYLAFMPTAAFARWVAGRTQASSD
jgi:hypothetical protein